jgi:hypothetical protein
MFHGTNSQFATSDGKYNYFSLTGDCYVYGNIMSLISATGYATLKRLDSGVEYTFAYLFANCTTLYNHPDKTLILSAEGLANYCYSFMFSGCTHLTKAPELPAETLKENCYEGMFNGCTSLIASPELAAEELVSKCYSSMFNGCSSLSSVTCFATSGINQDYSTYNWMSSAGSNVSGTKTFAKAASANVSNNQNGSNDTWPRSLNGIPTGWAVENY